MRQYSFGVLILLLGYTISQTLTVDQNNDGSSFIFNNPRDDSSSAELMNGDLEDEEEIRDEKTENQIRRDSTNENERPVVFSGNDKPEDDVAYWESIYGTEDVPDFEIPPEITGETIFMELSDLYDHEAEVKEHVQVKRDDHKIGSHFLQNSPSANNRYGESSESYLNSESNSAADYRGIATSVYQPHFYSHRDSPKNIETSPKFERDEYGKFYVSDNYSGTVNSPEIKRREEFVDADETDLEMEGDSAERFPRGLKSRSIKSSGTIDSLIDLKRKKIEVKKELIDDLISSKLSAIQAKKEFVHSLGDDINQNEGFSASVKIHSGKNTRSKSRTRTQSSSKSSVHQSALDTKKKIISTEKDSMTRDVCNGDGQTGSTNAIMRALDAKRELIEPVVSDEKSEMYYEREIGHGGAEDFGGDSSFHTNYELHGSAGYDNNKKIAPISTDSRYRDPFHSVLDSKRKVIQAKKDLIHTAVTGGSKAELASAVIRTLDAKKDLIDSVISSKAEIIQHKKSCDHSSCYAGETVPTAVEKSEVQSSMRNDDRQKGNFHQCSRCQKCSETSSDLRSGSKNSQSRHEAVIHSKVTKIKSSKSSHHSSAIGTSDLAVTGEIRTTDELRDIDRDSEVASSTMRKKVEIDGHITPDLHSRLNTHESGGDSSYSAKSDSSELKFINEMKTIHHTKSSVDSTVGETGSKDEIAENYDLSNADKERVTSSNENGEIRTGGQISTGQKTSFSKSRNKDKILTSSIRIDSTNTKSKEVKITSKVTTRIQNSDRLDLDVVKEEETELAARRDSEATNVSSEEKTRVASYSCKSHRKEEREKEDSNESSDTQLKCTPDKCGISGKLYVASEIADENEKLKENLSSEKIAESKLIDNSDAYEGEKRIVQIKIRPSVTEESQIVATDSQQERFDIEKKKGYHSNWNKDEEAREDDNERYDEEKAKKTQQDKQVKTKITATKNIAISGDTISKSIVVEIHKPENLLTKLIEKNKGIHEDEIEEANDHHDEWQATKKLSHLKNIGQSSHHRHLHENREFCGTSGILSNDADCRLINLDVNCSSNSAFMNPECQQLNTHLRHPQDSSMSVTLRTVKTYLNHGQELAIKMHNRAKWLCDKGYIPKQHTPAMLHLINNLATGRTVEINQESECSLFGIKLLQSNYFSEYEITPNTFLEFLKHHSFRVVGNGLCHARPKRCQNDQIYRSFDGSCNNRENPTWGQANTGYSRILPARYSDGIHEPAKSVTGSELPNPRVISFNCFFRKSINDNKRTLAVILWGQILSHDLAMQIPDQTTKGGIICCADEKSQLPKSLQHHSCLPIDIPSNDKFYSKFGARCMEFVRSMTVSREDCTLGSAEQLNTVTSYLDVSPLYGSDKETCDRHRAFRGGRMRVSFRRGRELLPITSNRSIYCDIMSPSEVCYSAGDLRVNQTPQLAILHTLLLREHNRIADKLSELNPHWSDEIVFQETRRIVLAECQFITYNEWLPVVLGKKYFQKYKIAPHRHRGDISQEYNPRIKANTINEFSTAAYRFFHSMIQGNVNLCPMSRDIAHTLRLSNHYFRPQIIEHSDNLDDLVRGMVTQPIQKSDDNFHPEITEYLFRSKNPYGLDLLTLDIQRGRDHGMGCYNDFRKICGLKHAKNFDDLKREISLESIENLKILYEHVDDIDLIVGIGLEKKCRGSILGPVARCLVGEQFYRSRISDRYFHDNPDQPYPFDQEQLDEIRKSSLAKLLCNTADNLEKIQPEVFKLISHSNPMMFCTALPDIDLSAWQELKYD